MQSTLFGVIGLLAATVVCVGAWLSGDRTVRLVAGIVLAAWMGSALAHDRSQLIRPQFAFLAIDSLLAALVTTLAVRHGGRWLIVAAAFSWLAVASHLGMLLDRRLLIRGYLTALGAYGYGMLAALAVGAWVNRRSHKERTPTPP